MTRFGPVAMLDWARSVPVGAGRDLAQTAMPSVPWCELGVDAERLASCGADAGAIEGELRALLARRHAVGEREIALASGSTQAAFCALAALIDPGAEVIVETPTYAPLVDLVHSLGAEVIALPRTEDNAFLPDPDDLRARLSPRTAAVVLTDLHNPSGVRLGDELVDRLLDAIEQGSDAHLFVDEVYLEFDPSPRPPSAYRSGRRVATTRSVTKGFGLSWLRTGWLQAPPELVERARRVGDYLQVYLPTPSALATCAALADDAARRERAATRVRAGFDQIRAALDGLDPVSLVAPHAAAPAICFPRIHPTDATELAARLLRDHDLAVAPGHLFGAPAHIRLACAAAPTALSGLRTYLATVLNH